MDSPKLETVGQVLSEAIQERGWTQRVVAAVVGIDASVLSRILADARPLDAHLALAFSEVFGIPAERLLSVQQTYELAKARLTARPDPGRAKRAQMLGELPIAEMVARGWIGTCDVRDVASVQAELTKFFGDAAGDVDHAAKKSEPESDLTAIQRAWLRQVQKIASSIQQIPRYTPAAVREAISEMETLRASVDGVGKVGAILAKCGIRLVIVQPLPASKIDGVCFWLNDMAPVIGLTLRHDRIDNFWFVLRHELEHVLRGHGRRRPRIDVDLDGEHASAEVGIPEEERVANAAAADFCVPKEQMDLFVAKKSPYFLERDVLGFAASLRVHPGLVVGQIQRRTGRYERFRKHLAKVRGVIGDDVAVDGWGRQFPFYSDTVRSK